MLRLSLSLCLLLCLVATAVAGSVADPSATIGQAKLLVSGSSVSVTGSVTLLGPTECYLQSTNNSCGIWVTCGSTEGYQIGDIASATGTVGVVDGECVIRDATLTRQEGTSPSRIVAMRNSWVGGGALGNQQASSDRKGTWKPASGANNTGLIIKTWGTVTAVCYSPITNAHWFQIDDGSGATADYGDSGIIVYSDASVNEGDFVTVTGISSVETALDDATRLVRVVRSRSSEDVSVARTAPPPARIYPFSDEFESPTMDNRWICLGDPAAYSLKLDSGSLSLINQPSLLQQVPGNWDMEAKVRVPLPLSSDESWCIGLHFFLQRKMDASGYPYRVVAASFNADYPNTFVKLADQYAEPATSEAIWLRLRMRRPMVYASVSPDGTTYTAERSVSADYPYMRLDGCGINGRYPSVDYIRFTRVDR